MEKVNVKISEGATDSGDTEFEVSESLKDLQAYKGDNKETMSTAALPGNEQVDAPARLSNGEKIGASDGICSLDAQGVPASAVSTLINESSLSNSKDKETKGQNEVLANLSTNNKCLKNELENVKSFIPDEQSNDMEISVCSESNSQLKSFKAHHVEEQADILTDATIPFEGETTFFNGHTALNLAQDNFKMVTVPVGTRMHEETVKDSLVSGNAAEDKLIVQDGLESVHSPNETVEQQKTSAETISQEVTAGLMDAEEVQIKEEPEDIDDPAEIQGGGQGNDEDRNSADVPTATVVVEEVQVKQEPEDIDDPTEIQGCLQDNDGNGNSADIPSTTTVVVEEVQVKQEPMDDGYSSQVLLHRAGPIVVYSDDSDDDSSSDGLSVPCIATRLDELEELSSGEETGKSKPTAKVNVMKNRSRTEGELFPEELPPLEYMTISADEIENLELEPLGVISGIVDILVVVKANDNSPALYDDTILFLESRKPLGLIFETFGTVERPFYSVRFNKVEDIADGGIEVGQKVYFAPKADNLTKYVFIAELRKIKCDDASWKNDNEVPASLRDYSDDEEERREKWRLKNKNRLQDTSQDNTTSESDQPRRKRKHLTKKRNQVPPDPCQPRLLPGELNRNPFGNQGQMFNAPPANKWPPQQTINKNNSTLEMQPPPPFPPSNRPRPPVNASFGQHPPWVPKPAMGQLRHSGAPNRPFQGAPPFVNPPPFSSQGQPRPPFSPARPSPSFSVPSFDPTRPPGGQVFPPRPGQFQQPSCWSSSGGPPQQTSFNPNMPPPPMFGRPDFRPQQRFPVFNPSHPPPANNSSRLFSQK